MFTCPVCGRVSHHPEDVANGYCGACHEYTGRWRRLATGVYDDGAGGLHILAGELLRANGWEDTPANRDTLERAAREAFG